MENTRFRSVAAGALAIASVSALFAACGDDDDNGGETQADTTPTQPQATTSATVAAATAAPAKSTFLAVDVDTVRGSKNIADAEKATQSCVQANQFAKNEQIVFRIRVYDPATGKLLDDKAVDKIVVAFKNGQTLDPAKYGAHPKTEPNEYFWTQSFVIPETFPTGTIDFTVTATDKEGRTGAFTPIHFAATALLQVLEKVRPVIPTP
ncbi:MAG: hypothetical protein IT304_06700 [Dehalococcoidia bacterium]|nr:hypothetical protein [Dehalococcoidia bacterium]